MALGTGIGRGGSDLFQTCVARVLFFGDIHLDVDVLRHGNSPRRDGSFRELGKPRCDLCQRYHMIGVDVLQGLPRHRRKRRVSGILHHGHTTKLLDRPEPCGAIVEIACQNDAYRARTVDLSGRSEQRIDRRPEVVLPRSLRHPHSPRLHQQVAIGRRHIHMSSLQSGPVGRHRHRKPGRALKELGHHTRRLWRDMKNDADRRRQLGRKLGEDRSKRVDTSGGRSDHHNAPCGTHVSCATSFDCPSTSLYYGVLMMERSR